MTPPMDHEAKARELAERGWLGEWEYEEEREDAIHEVATALREERERTIDQCAIRGRLAQLEDKVVDVEIHALKDGT